jgi:Protein of unknown function (DUF3352)
VSLRAVLAALVVALGLAGCGGGGGSGNASAVGADSAAAIAPAEAVLYASVNTDLDSEQWQRLEALLDRFPGRDKLVGTITDALRDEDITAEEIRAAAGPTLEVVALGLDDESGVVGLAQPKDEARFRALFAETDEPLVFREIEGWTVFAESEAALGRFEEARGDSSLADGELFQELIGELPEDALVKGWFDGEGVSAAAAQQLGATSTLGKLQPDTASFAVEAAEEGLRMVAHIRNEDIDIESPDFGELAEQVPSDAFAFVSAHGYDGQLKVTEQFRSLPGFGVMAGQAEQAIGVTLEDVSTLFNRELVLWVRPGAVIPEVTLVLEVEDEAEARSTLDRIVAAAGGLGVGQRTERKVGDVEVTQVDLGQLALLYAAFDGKLVVTTQASGIEALTGDVDRLVDESRYEDALEAAGVADGEQVIMWVDLERTLDVVETLSGLQGEPIPPDVRANIEPLESVVLSVDPSLEDGSGRLFVHVR